MARAMTPTEKTTYKGLFPKLDTDAAVVTDEATPVYNCLAWTLGFTDRWIWPGENAADFDRLYGQYGFQRANNGPIAAWGQSQSQMTHGCISGKGHGPRWESKLGQLLRIQHGLSELEGAAYGKVQFFYDKSQLAAVPPGANRVATLMDELRLTDADIKTLAAETNDVVPALRKRFEKLYAAWRKTWARADIALSSDPSAVRHSAEYLALAALGPQIIPLIVERLSKEDEFFALQLYDAVQENPALIISLHSDERVLGGEQLRAMETVKRYLAR